MQKTSIWMRTRQLWHQSIESSLNHAQKMEVAPYFFSFFLPAFSFSALIWAASPDLSAAAPAFAWPALPARLARAALAAAAASAGSSSFFSSSTLAASAAWAFFFSFFLRFLELFSPAWAAAAAGFFSSLTSSLGSSLTSPRRAANSASFWASYSFLESCLGLASSFSTVAKKDKIRSNSWLKFWLLFNHDSWKSFHSAWVKFSS